MDLNILFKEFRQTAAPLGGYEKIPINELANKYCEATDNGDSDTRNIYFAALILRFWYKINKTYQENISLGIEIDDCFNWLVDAITLACKPENRNWQTNPALNAQQVINQTFATRFVAQAYYESNLQKNKGKHYTTSLEAALGNDDENDSLIDLIEDESTPTYTDNGEVISLIQGYIDKNKLVEAIILDNIAFKDSFKHEHKSISYVDSEGEKQKYTEYYSTFWPFKVVKEISSLNDEYKKYFTETYDVSKPAFEAAFKAIGKANNQKRYKYLEATLGSLKRELSAF